MNVRILSGMIAVCLVITGESHARVTTLSGAVSVGYEDYERNYDVDRDSSSSDDYSRIVISPSITIVTESARDILEVEYSPNFRFDLDDSDENDVDHRFILDYQRMLTERWEFTLTDNFLQSDEANSFAPVRDEETGLIISEIPGEDLATGESLTDDQGIRRFYTNALSFGTRYFYQEGSYFSANYTWSILRNDEDDENSSSYQDYDKHAFRGELGHLISTNWFAAFNLGYVIGDYEEDEITEFSSDSSDDLNEYSVGIRGEYRLSATESYNAAYNYSLADYESSLQQDNEIHDIVFGWSKDFSPKTSFSIGAGPTYSKADGESGEWSLNGNMALRRRFEKGSYNLTAAAGSELNNFSGTDQRGTTDYWQLQADINYTPIQYLTLNAYLTYRQEDEDELVEIDLETGEDEPVTELVPMSVTSNRYALGCGLEYRLSEHYSLGFDYTYILYESDLAEKEYDSHKIMLSLKYENDFLRW